MGKEYTLIPFNPNVPKGNFTLHLAKKYLSIKPDAKLPMQTFMLLQNEYDIYICFVLIQL